METITKPKWLFKTTLSKQLLSSFVVSLLAIGSVTLGVNYVLVKVNLETQIKQQASSITQGLEFATEGLFNYGDKTLLRRVVQNYATLPAVEEVAIVNPEGKAIASSSAKLKDKIYAEVYPDLAELLREAAKTGKAFSHKSRYDRQDVLVEILPFSSPLFQVKGKRGLAIVHVNLQLMEEQSWEIFMTSSLTLVSGTFVMLVMMAFLLHKLVLKPLSRLGKAVDESQSTGTFLIPDAIRNQEIKFLAKTFERVFQKLATYEQLKNEIEKRKQAEMALRNSAERERKKSSQLELTLFQLKQTQSELIHAEKMSGLAQIVAGFAHEINNPISFIYGNIEPAKTYIEDLLELIRLYQHYYPEIVPEIDELQEDIDLEFLIEDFENLLNSMKVGADRIREIVLALRTFSHLDESELKEVNIHQGIDSTLLLLDSRFRASSSPGSIQLIKEYHTLPLVYCYPSQLNQVFMNLFINAIDAVNDREKKSQGKFTKEIRLKTELINERRIRVTIKDNGLGIPEDAKPHLFEPFFTTKSVGEGKGLGLSIAYHVIVEQHQGVLDYHSEEGQGTEFIVEIPINFSGE